MTSEEITNVVRYLSVAFAKAVEPVSTGKDPVKGTQLYDWQVEFCWLIDEIQRGAWFTTTKHVIAQANDLIKQVKEAVADGMQKGA